MWFIFTFPFFEFPYEIRFIFQVKLCFHFSLTFKFNFFDAVIHYELSNDISNSLDFQFRYFIISFLF